MYDVSALPDVAVDGFATSPDYSAIGALKNLGKAYFFDIQEADGVLKFIPRGGASVATITEDEFVIGEDEPDEDTTKDTITVPRLIHFVYFDIDGGQQADKQFSERGLSLRVEQPVVISSPIVMTAEKAAEVVAINHKVIEEELRGELKFGVSDKLLELAVADVVTLQYRGRVVRCRITKIELEDGWQRITAMRDRASAYTAHATAVPPAPVTPPPASDVGATRYAFINAPALVADVAGYYIGLSGESEGWRGGVVERDTFGAFSTLLTDGTGTQMGELLDPLPMASEHYTDATNIIRVELYNPADELSSITRDQLLSRGNACAIVRPDGTAELVQFQDAEETTEGVWELSGLLRGRLNSKATAHEAGAQFVFLLGVNLVPISADLINTTQTHRYYSFTRPADSGGTSTDSLSPLLMQREWPPVIEDVTLDSSDNVAVTWTPRYRFGGDLNPVASVNFSGWFAEVSNGTVAVFTETLPSVTTATIDTTLIGPPPYTVRVYGVNRLTGLGEASEFVV
jgi:hypothetical protein